VRHISEVFRSQIVVLLPGAGGESLMPWSEGQFTLDSNELGVAKWVHEHHQPAGLGTATLPGAAALYLALQAPRGPVGVLGIRPADRHALDSPDQLHQLETFSNQTAVATPRASRGRGAAGPVRIETDGCATRCSARSRTICGRRWPRSKARHHHARQRHDSTPTRRDLPNPYATNPIGSTVSSRTSSR
jgi:hypothetical protein